MTHYDQPLAFTERIHIIDPSLAMKVENWETHLPREQYGDRVREMLEGLEEARKWEGTDGDDAYRLYNMTRDHLKNDLRREA